MDLSGWDIDLRAVYGDSSWERRSRFHLREWLYESPYFNCAALFFGVGEVGLNKQVGALALFRDKTTPRMVWHSGRTLFWFEGLPQEPIFFAADGRTARLCEYLPSVGGKLGWRERVLDLQAGELLAPPSSPWRQWGRIRLLLKILAVLLALVLFAEASRKLIFKVLCIK